MIKYFDKQENKVNIKEAIFSCRREDIVLRGTEYRPEGDNLPIAIVCHGFMAFQDTVRQYAKALANLGYAAYCFDFSGGCVMKGKSDGKTTDMSVLTEVKDLEAVLEYTSSLSYTDASKVILMGCSQGGFVSAITASKLKDKVAKLVLFYPAFCIPDDARAGKMMFAKFDPNNIPDLIQCGPMKLGKCYVEDVINMNPYAEIKDFHGDVLIVHGTNDNIVGMKYIEDAHHTYLNEKTLNNCENYISLKIIDGGRHSFSKKHDKLAIKYLEEFLKED